MRAIYRLLYLLGTCQFNGFAVVTVTLKVVFLKRPGTIVREGIPRLIKLFSYLPKLVQEPGFSLLGHGQFPLLVKKSCSAISILESSSLSLLLSNIDTEIRSWLQTSEQM